MTSKKPSISELIEQFKKMESAHDLFNKKTNENVYYWDILRYWVFMAILSKNGYFAEHDYFSVPKQESFIKKTTKSVYYLFRLLLNGAKPFYKKKNNDYVFFFVSRFEDQLGNPVDFILKDIYSSLKNRAYCIELFRHKAYSVFNSNTANIYFPFKLDLISLWTKKGRFEWQDLINLINTEFDFEINWQPIFDQKLFEYKNEYSFYTNLFKKINPRYVFYQTFPKGMVAAANDLNITTIDVLHGYANGLSIFYNYPKDGIFNLNTLPKKLFTFSKYSSSILDFPVTKVVAGNNYFFEQKSISDSIKSATMIVSGLFIHDYLSEATYNLATEHPDIIFYYKLHSNQGQQELQCRKYFSPLSNVTVIYTEKNVNEIMNDCFAIILIQSTVTYQALQKGLKVFIFKKDYYEISYDVFNEPGVFLVDNWKELSTLLSNKSIQKGEVSKTMFFEPFNKKVLEELISF